MPFLTKSFHSFICFNVDCLVWPFSKTITAVKLFWDLYRCRLGTIFRGNITKIVSFSFLSGAHKEAPCCNLLHLFMAFTRIVLHDNTPIVWSSIKILVLSFVDGHLVWDFFRTSSLNHSVLRLMPCALLASPNTFSMMPANQLEVGEIQISNNSSLVSKQI